MLGVADRDRQRVGRVGRRGGRGGQQHPHHHRHLRLFRVADADDRLLDEVGGVFRDRQARQRQRRERDAARLAEFQRRLRVAVDERLLDRRFVRPLRSTISASADGSQPAARRATLAASVWIEPQQRSSAATRQPRSPPSRSRAGRGRCRGCESRRWSWRRLIYEFPCQRILAHGRRGVAGPVPKRARFSRRK